MPGEYGDLMTDDTFPSIEQWWPRLPEHVRDAIAAAPYARLSPASVVAVTRARGVGPAGAHFPGDAPDYALDDADAEWIEAHVHDADAS